MSTILQLLNQALMLCGMRASGETVDAALAQDALDTLHQMIAAWNLDSLLVYQIVRQVVPMTTSQTYTVGVGGTINLPRPVRIDAINWRDEAQTPALELPLHKMEQQEYQAQRVRETAASMPTAFYYDPAYPLGTLFLWPRPMETKKLVLFVWKTFDASMVLSDTVVMPPGYERMLVYNLAVELSAQPGARLSPVALRLAEQSKTAIEVINARIPILSVPSGLFGGSGRGWNPTTGE
jgi:hypothetical protein